MVLIQRPEWGGGEVWFDDELILKDGLFVPSKGSTLSLVRFRDFIKVVLASYRGVKTWPECRSRDSASRRRSSPPLTKYRILPNSYGMQCKRLINLLSEN
jgi:hypothetical protein